MELAVLAGTQDMNFPDFEKLYNLHYSKFASWNGDKILANDIHDGGCELLKIMVDKRMVGIAKWVPHFYDEEISQGWVSREKDFGLLDMLELNENEQGKGYGTEFMIEFENYIKKRGVKILVIGTPATNEKAAHLYRKMGYIGKNGYFDEDGNNFIFVKRI